MNYYSLLYIFCISFSLCYKPKQQSRWGSVQMNSMMELCAAAAGSNLPKHKYDIHFPDITEFILEFMIESLGHCWLRWFRDTKKPGFYTVIHFHLWSLELHKKTLGFFFFPRKNQRPLNYHRETERFQTFLWGSFRKFPTNRNSVTNESTENYWSETYGHTVGQGTEQLIDATLTWIPDMLRGCGQQVSLGR